MSLLPGTIRKPRDYKSRTLPIELRRHTLWGVYLGEDVLIITEHFTTGLTLGFFLIPGSF